MFTITIRPEDLDHFRTMLREQLAGDSELGREILAGRASRDRLADALCRLLMVEELAAQVGGFFGSEFALELAGGRPGS